MGRDLFARAPLRTAAIITGVLYSLEERFPPPFFPSPSRSNLFFGYTYLASNGSALGFQEITCLLIDLKRVVIIYIFVYLFSVGLISILIAPIVNRVFVITLWGPRHGFSWIALYLSRPPKVLFGESLRAQALLSFKAILDVSSLIVVVDLCQRFLLLSLVFDWRGGPLWVNLDPRHIRRYLYLARSLGILISIHA